MDSVATTRSLTSTGPRPDSAATIWLTMAGGAEAPAVMPDDRRPGEPAQLDVLRPVDQVGGRAARSAVSTRRREFDEFAEPATSTTSDSAAIARTASWRFVVA